MRVLIGRKQEACLRALGDARVDAALNAAPGRRRKNVVLPFIAWEQISARMTKSSLNEFGRTTELGRKSGAWSLARTLSRRIAEQEELAVGDYRIDRAPSYVAWLGSGRGVSLRPRKGDVMMVRFLDRKRIHWLSINGKMVRLSCRLWVHTPHFANHNIRNLEDLCLNGALHWSFVNEPIR